MRDSIRFVVLAVLLSTFAGSAQADMGSVTRITLETCAWTYQTGNAGEYRATVIGGPVSVNGHVLTTGTEFLTFCVEEAENVSAATANYWAILNAAVVQGGTGSYVGGNLLYKATLDPTHSGADSRGQSARGDPLDERTAYLYTQFAKGMLSGYDFADTNALAGGRHGSAWALQNAFWFFEQDVAGISGGVGTATQQAAERALANGWIAEANDAVASGQWSGLGNVAVMNLYSSYNASIGKVGATNQDVLVYVVPAPGAIVLGIMGMSLVGWIKRKQVV